MNMLECIEKKRDGLELSEAEIKFIIDEAVSGNIPDYQLTAWMMAVCCRGMSDRETAALTMAMMHSGSIVDLSSIDGVKVDKHSTGGVGDTTTLIVAPLVAACGGVVAKLSGRGLGHSGGTLDKLESVPGVCVEQTLDRFIQIVRETGLCVIGQSADLDPADKLLYALRDVSGTVKSIPLIASSILSKKFASGADAIVLDVKTGSGAFMETLDEARQLAEIMVAIGDKAGKKVVSIITNMNCPLGNAVGNGLEMREAIEALKGRKSKDDPLMRVSIALASHMLRLSGIIDDTNAGEEKLLRAIESGAAYSKLRDMLRELGGDTKFVDDPDLLVKARRIVPVYMGKSGYVSAIDAHSIGAASVLIGAGRLRKGDPIDYSAGILMNKRCGEFIGRDEPIAFIYLNDESKLAQVESMVAGAVALGGEPCAAQPVIYDVIQ